MSKTKYFPNLCLAKKQRWILKTQKELKEVTICNKLVLLICFIFFSTTYVNAQKGFFVKFSLGPGYTTENSNINESGLSIGTKNHAIGWGFNDKYALYIGEFGGLNKIAVGEYNYINLDVVGLGFTYRSPNNIKLSVSGAYGRVSFARDWKEPMGDKKGNGYGINMSLDKEWFIAKRWGIAIGPQAYLIKTQEPDYQFMNISFNCSVSFYLKPIR
ncbi:hypothetical protein KJ656_07015 [bacterium]|nr:hypothetical protein [bacterium]